MAWRNWLNLLGLASRGPTSANDTATVEIERPGSRDLAENSFAPTVLFMPSASDDDSSDPLEFIARNSDTVLLKTDATRTAPKNPADDDLLTIADSTSDDDLTAFIRGDQPDGTLCIAPASDDAVGDDRTAFIPGDQPERATSVRFANSPRTGR